MRDKRTPTDVCGEANNKPFNTLSGFVHAAERF